MKDKSWWQVENLKKHEEKVLNINNLADLEAPDMGDFGSYRKVLKGENIQNTILASHNDLNSKNKILYINKLISFKHNDTFTILDVGCGVGFTSDELSKFYKNSKITGVDISSDAIKFATDNFKNIEFICQGIEPTNPPLGYYDLVFCFEFYPFTRTNSLQTHKDYLDYFLLQLKEHGRLVLHQAWENDISISKNIDELKKEFNQYRFETHEIPHAKVISFIGNNYLSIVIDKILRFILRKNHMKAIIIYKK
jgi:SAM-dependent methyltransferase